jgi:hypothetical protein
VMPLVLKLFQQYSKFSPNHSKQNMLYKIWKFRWNTKRGPQAPSQLFNFSNHWFNLSCHMNWI